MASSTPFTRGVRAYDLPAAPAAPAPDLFYPPARALPQLPPRPYRASARTGRHVENLEDRRLLSSVALNDGVLTLTGNSNTENKLTAEYIASKDQILAVATGQLQYIPRNLVSRIEIVGGELFDRVYVNPTLTAPTTIRTFGGNDSILGGGGVDTIDSGAGNDFIHGYNGNDSVKAGDGNDSLYGDAGNDLLAGGAGDDSLIGGDGADTIDPGTGTNTGITSADTVINSGGTTGGSTGGTTGGTTGGSTGGTAPPVVSQPTGDNTAVAYGTAADSTSPRAVLNLIGKVGTAAHPVHVNALSSSYGAGSALSARFEWDFGDPNGRFNTLVGWNAAHVYDRPGTYTVKLTVTNELGKRGTVSTQVTVNADTRRAFYVDAVNGSDSNNGLSSDRAVRTFSKAASLLASNPNDTKVLFRRGQKFTAGKSLSVTGKNVLIGAYGSGENPVFNRLDVNGASTIATYGGSDRVVIQDLTFDSERRPTGNVVGHIKPGGIHTHGGRNIVVRNSKFLNVDDAVNAAGAPTGLLVMDNSAPLQTGLRGYFVWGQGSDHVYLGNSAANSTREHIVRTYGLTRVLVAHNDFTNADRSSVDSADYNKGTVELRGGSWGYVANNQIRKGQIRVGPSGGTSESTSVKYENSVFEGNQINGVQVRVYPGTFHSVFRNNVVRRDGDVAFAVTPEDGLGRTVGDLRFLNNTVVNNSTTGKFLWVGGGEVDGITFRNNLWIAPNVIPGGYGTAGLFSNDTDLSDFRVISDNVWAKPSRWYSYAPGGMHYLWPYWSDPRGYLDAGEWEAQSKVSNERYSNTPTDSRLMPLSGSVAATAGKAAPGVLVDLYGRARPTGGTVTAGAVQTV